MIRIESGDIIRKVQDHWTTKQILDYFQMDESTFKINLQKSLNPKAYNGLMRELKRNDKLGGKSKKYTQKKCIEIPIANVNNAILVKDSKEEAKEIEKNFSTIQVIKNKISTLNSLISQLSKISSEYEESITDLKSSIEDNKKSIDKMEKENAEFTAKLDEIYQEQKKHDLLLTEKQEELKKLNQELEQLKTINIFFHENGEIEIEDPEKAEKKPITVSTNSDTLSLLLRYSELENFTLKTLKSLANLIGYVKKLKIINKKFEVIFEDEILEKIFHELS